MDEHAIVVNDNSDYLHMAMDTLQKAGFRPDHVHCTDRVEVAQRLDFPALLVVLDSLDSRNQGSGVNPSYWEALLVLFRKKNPHAMIILVSGRSEMDLKTEVGGYDEETRHLLDTDPLLRFLPKGEKESESASHEHFRILGYLAARLLVRKEQRKTLQGILVRAVFEAGRDILGEPIRELHKELKTINAERPDYALTVGKEDTLFMDVIAEHSAERNLLPVMHNMDVELITEEAGVFNGLYHRISNPYFFVFSDPFDGSGAFETFTKRVGKDHSDRTMKELVGDAGIMAKWNTGPPDCSYGPIQLNSPMISMVLAQRHRVVGAVLLNLYTLDVYLSLDTGNYTKNFAGAFLGGGDILAEAENIARLIADENRDETWADAGWSPVRFRDYSSFAGQDDHLFLCSLGAVKRRENKEHSWINAHAERCVRPLLPEKYYWQDSFDLRYDQRDFTPGPGRILFLTSCQAAEAYSSEALGGRGYRSILSCGEAITEWIGWLAFLRHAKGISAYCLRPMKYALDDQAKATEVCNHRRDEIDPAPMLPNELVSVFRDGYMDIGILHSAYASKMRNYKETIAVVFDGDEAWHQELVRPDGHDRYVKIPLLQPSWA